jgi:hypothetical protein
MSERASTGVLHLVAALELDRVRAGLLQEAAGVPHRVLDGDRVAEEGHVADDQGPLGPAAHGGRVVDHLVHGHGQRRVVAEAHVRDRVAHEDHVDPGRVDDLRVIVGVGREHRQPLAALALADAGDGLTLLFGGGVGGHVPCRCARAR